MELLFKFSLLVTSLCPLEIVGEDEAIKKVEAKRQKTMLESNEKNNLDVISFTNIDSKDFEGMWGGVITVIKAGETKPFPRFLAYHYAKHLVNKILLSGGNDFGDELKRKPLEEKILGIVSITPEAPETSKAEEVPIESPIETSEAPKEEVITPPEEFIDIPKEVKIIKKSKKA
jgi:hypothetical protein